MSLLFVSAFPCLSELVWAGFPKSNRSACCPSFPHSLMKEEVATHNKNGQIPARHISSLRQYQCLPSLPCEVGERGSTLLFIRKFHVAFRDLLGSLYINIYILFFSQQGRTSLPFPVTCSCLKSNPRLVSRLEVLFCRIAFARSPK